MDSVNFASSNENMQMMPYQMIYPEIFYRMQPYIVMVVDEMDMYGSMMPTQEMIESITDSIHDDILKMYPDMAEYVNENPSRSNIAAPASFDSDFRRRFRRRGLFKDIIDILLLNEFLRRRRRYYY